MFPESKSAVKYTLLPSTIKYLLHDLLLITKGYSAYPAGMIIIQVNNLFILCFQYFIVILIDSPKLEIMILIR